MINAPKIAANFFSWKILDGKCKELILSLVQNMVVLIEDLALEILPSWKFCFRRGHMDVFQNESVPIAGTTSAVCGTL